MFAISSQPRTTCPNAKSRPFQYEITTDEHIAQTGTLAFFQMTFSAGGEGDGVQITIAGQVFTTESSTPFTFNTFDASGTAEETRDNLYNALRSNFYFQNYIIFTSEGGGSFTVQAFYYDFAEVPNWTFDTSLLTIAHSLIESNGQPYLYRNMRIWYRLFNNVTPLTNLRFADIPAVLDDPFSSTVMIDLMEVLRGVVFTTRPLLHTSGPQLDLAFFEEMHLKVGIVETDDSCNTVFTKSLQSSNAFAVNSVFQLHETDEMKPHCLAFASPLVKFLSNRPLSGVSCPSSHEWIHIWMEQIENQVGDFYIIYSLYGDLDPLSAPIHEDTLSFSADDQAYQIDLGPGNPYLAALMAAFPATRRYTAQVWVDEFIEGPGVVPRPYSELLERVIVGCNCFEAEIYYLEDKGSWRTLVFERLISRSVVQTADEYEQDVNWQSGVRQSEIYADGGRYSSSRDVDHVFVLESPKFIDRERSAWEELLRSPVVLIKTSSDAGIVTRRIILDKQSYDVFNRGQAGRLRIPFRFNNKVLVH